MIVPMGHARLGRLLLQPAKDCAGALVGLEIIYAGPDVSPGNDIALFTDKLTLLSQSELFFIRRELTAWIAITPTIAAALISDMALLASARRFPFLALLVSEDFSDPALLEGLRQHFPLVLANFGAGDAAPGFAFSGLFSAVFFDAAFIHRQISRASFTPFMRALMAQMAPAFCAVMAAGVDDRFTLERLMPWGLYAMKGTLWPAVEVGHLTQLVQE
ncbi:EAL domain-containing protein [Pluralibacter gergoviae]|uniref:EAL domain-containing protein n=2 Tax=Pluralibacter gergoviae TaxID=61647 RepID=A0AAI9DN39_PLUGE|nr:EAL domain-containing protein [Pluralibacter gergoviae]EKV9910659.1 EAL domain-containing protein [Pluralibacter gergoviae]EKW7276631.1 EAL domain-containing protein [Pluralibacter gergoviae]ELD4298221.1 EAL domain-containing protein [Pluralibacter gergoviae]ELD4308913.1 EAL domain-containing protein [Pluralibacter gergoviae]